MHRGHAPFWDRQCSSDTAARQVLRQPVVGSVTPKDEERKRARDRGRPVGRESDDDGEFDGVENPEERSASIDVDTVAPYGATYRVDETENPCRSPSRPYGVTSNRPESGLFMR